METKMNEDMLKELVGTVQHLIQTNLRYEVLIRAMVEVMGTKKQTDGTPFITVEELNATAEKIKNQIIEQSAAAAKAATIVKPDNTIVVPNV